MRRWLIAALLMGGVTSTTAFIECTNSEADIDDCIDRCEDCVDQNACESNQWQCSSECAAVIEQSTATDVPVQ